MVALAAAVTAVVVTTNVAVVLPAFTVTVAGTTAEALLLDSEITALLGAAAVNVTVPVDELPPLTVVGLSEKSENPTTVSPETRVTPLETEVIAGLAV
jgi:hypothetical protein